MSKLTEVLAKIREANPETKQIVAIGAPTRANKETIYRYEPLHIGHLLKAIDMPGDTRYESTVIKRDGIKIAMPNGKVTHFIDEINGTPGTNYDWAEFELNLTQPLEQQLQSNPELVETLYSLLVTH